MTRLVLGLALKVEPWRRKEYLDTLLSILPEAEQQDNGLAGDACTDLILQISRLSEEVRHRLESIEDGSYWDDPDETDWDAHYSDDDSPEPLSAEQQDELCEYFSEAGEWYVSGDKESARRMYENLFSLVDEVSAFDYLPDMEIDLREARARYVRCAYDLEQPAQRAGVVLSVMLPGREENADCALIAQGLRHYSAQHHCFFVDFTDHSDDSGQCCEETITGLEQVHLSKDLKKRYLAWCLSVADKRVREILTNTYRNAYGRAALVLAGLAECLIEPDDPDTAKGLLRNYCRVEFSRFSAFRREMREAVGRSPSMVGWDKAL